MNVSVVLTLVFASQCNAFIHYPSNKASGFYTDSRTSLDIGTIGNFGSKSSLMAGNVFDDLFSSFKQMMEPKSVEKVKNDYDEPIQQALQVLYRAADTKKEDPEVVVDALESLEKLMRSKCKAEDSAAQDVLDNLNGDWRLVFTTGTKQTQEKFGAKINYFPLKAVQSFNPTVNPFKIENGIYLGDFALIKFFGDFEFNLKSRKLEFDFDRIAVLGFSINLGKGKAAELGAASGLGSENNKQLVTKNKKPFFNWISADGRIATARGGGGGLALWKKVSDSVVNTAEIPKESSQQIFEKEKDIDIITTEIESASPANEVITVKSGKNIQYDEVSGRFFEG